VLCYALLELEVETAESGAVLKLGLVVNIAGAEAIDLYPTCTYKSGMLFT